MNMNLNPTPSGVNCHPPPPPPPNLSSLKSNINLTSRSAERIPESLFPGTFDIVGSSHQIFHCFVLLGAWFQFSALRWMVVGNAGAV
jgi:hypothetical protein